MFIVKNKYDNSLSYYYRILEGNEYIILDKNSNNIMQSIISNEHVQGGQVDCIKDTVAYIKNACEQSVSCSVACDLSPNCTTYMYIIAAAHCAASGNKPPTQLIAAD